MFLNLFIGLVKFGKQKFTVSCEFVFGFLFVVFYLMHSLKWLFQLKINNNLPPKICGENVVDVVLL